MAEGHVSRLNAICVVDGSGEIVSEGTVISEPSAIAEYLKTKAGSARRIGLETGRLGCGMSSGRSACR